MVAFLVSTTNWGLLHNGLVVVRGVVGNNHHGVILSQVVERRVGHVQIVLAATAHGGEIGVVVGNDSAFIAQQLDDGEGRRLAQVVDIALVGQAEHQHLRSVDGFALLIEACGDLVENEVRHVGVDFARKLDEAGAEVELLGLPG